MIKINLLPKIAQAGPADYPAVLYAGVASAVIAAGVVFVMNSQQQKAMADAQLRLQQVDEKYNRERGEIEAAEKAKQDLRYIEEKEKWVLAQTNAQKEWGTFLTELKDYIPQDTWLLEMEAKNTEKSVKFRGRGFTMSSVANFLLQIGRSKSIQALNLKTVRRSEIVVEENRKEREQAQERQKHTDEVVEVPDEVPGIGFDVRQFEPMDFEAEGKFELKPAAAAAAGAPPAPTGAPPVPGAPQ